MGLIKALLMFAVRAVWQTLLTVWIAAVVALTVWLLAEVVLRATGSVGLAERIVEMAG